MQKPNKFLSSIHPVFNALKKLVNGCKSGSNLKYFPPGNSDVVIVWQKLQ